MFYTGAKCLALVGLGLVVCGGARWWTAGGVKFLVGFVWVFDSIGKGAIR